MIDQVTPKVWIGCLASYNAGRLIGEWTDATDLDEMEECQKQVAAQAVAAAKEAGEWPVYFTEPEEFFLADNEGFGNAIGEYTPLEKVAELGQAIEEHGAPFLAFLEIYDGVETNDAWTITNEFQDQYQGEYGSMKEFAYDYVDSCGWNGMESIPAELKNYLDWDMIARDLEMDMTETNGFIFRNW